MSAQPARSMHELRRATRAPYVVPMRLTFDSAAGKVETRETHTIDGNEYGLGFVSATEVPQTFVNVAIDSPAGQRLLLRGKVMHCRQVDATNWIGGLQLESVDLRLSALRIDMSRLHI